MRFAQAAEATSAASPRIGTDRWLIALAYALLTAAALYPVFSVEILPLVDYPAHLARLHVLASLDDVPLLAERYAAAWAVLPNLAMDAIVFALAGWLPVADALRLFVALSLVMIVAGCLSLHRALFGGLGVVPAAAFLVLYNHVLTYGFINYYFGIGLFLLVFAAWIAAREWPALVRFALFSAAATALFFAHLFAFGVYGLCVAGYELWRLSASRGASIRTHLRDGAVTMSQFVLPIALWTMSPTGERTAFTSYGGFVNKLTALLSPAWCYGGPVDLAVFAFLGFVLIRGYFSGALRVAPALRYPLMILLPAAIAMPSWLLGVWGVDFRLPVVLILLTAAGARVELPSARTAMVLAAAALALFGARIWTVADTWRGYDAQFNEFRAASHAIESGARLLVVQRPREREFDQVYWHLASLAVIERSVFLPFLFSDPTAVPMRAADAYRHIDSPFGRPITPAMLRAAAEQGAAESLGRRLAYGGRVYWAGWPRNFDYVLFVHFGAGDNPMPELLRQVHAGSFFAIYRVEREAGG